MVFILIYIIFVFGNDIRKEKGDFLEDLTERQRKMINTLTQAMPYLRKELGVSQTVLAAKVEMTRQMISMIERGKQPMTWTQFLAIVFFLKSNNNKKRARAVAKKQPNVIEQLLLLESDMNYYEKRGQIK